MSSSASGTVGPAVEGGRGPLPQQVAVGQVGERVVEGAVPQLGRLAGQLHPLALQLGGDRRRLPTPA